MTVASELWSFQVTIPAGTAQSSPYRQKTTLPTRKVDTLEITIPPGPSGLMGFAVTMGGINVVPVNSGTYIVTDNEKISWPLTGLPDSGDWQVSGYNLDVFDHTVYLRFLVETVPQPSQTGAVAGASLQQLSS